MNTNKKLLYTIVCMLALQAAVPAHASIWSSVATWWNNVPEQSKRTAGIVAASLTALCALGYSAYALCKKKKKEVAVVIAAPVTTKVVMQPVPVAVEVADPKAPDYIFMPTVVGPTEEELQQVAGNPFREIEKRYTKLKDCYGSLHDKYDTAYCDKRYSEARSLLGAINELLNGEMKRLNGNMRDLRNTYCAKNNEHVQLTKWIAQISIFSLNYINDVIELRMLEEVDQLMSSAIFG